MVRLNDLSYRYKDNAAPTIQNISFFIKKGEVVVLTGRSGCGKSTLFRCINGLCPHFFEGEKERQYLLERQREYTFADL